MTRCFAQVPRVKLHILSKKAWTPVRFSRYLSAYHVLRGDNEAQWTEDIRQMVQHTPIDVILPVAVSEVRFVSAYRESLKTLMAIAPVPELNVFETVINKLSLADFLSTHDIPGPTTILYKDNKDFEQQLQALSFPVLTKPIQGGGGRHIHYFENPIALLKFLRRKPWKFSDRYVVQNFIDGYDIHSYLLCQNGKILAYTLSKNVIPNSRQFGRPHGIQFVKDEQVFDWLTKFIAILGWSGMAHIDLRYDERDNQIKLIDFNPDWDMNILGALGTGVNFPYLACLAGLGSAFPLPDYSLKCFIRGKIAIQQGKQKYLGKSRVNFTFAETSWKYALHDPFAELIRLVQRFFPDKSG
jgi:predicted ATP-grasp superfamily ATP-dependent carboligase